MNYHDKFIKACRELGIGDVTIGHRSLASHHLTKEHWKMLYFAMLAFQHQAKLIVADSIAKEEVKE